MSSEPVKPQDLSRLMLALESLSEVEREALRRYYSMEQSVDQVCRDLRLGHAQFKALQARVKRAFRAKPPQ